MSTGTSIEWTDATWSPLRARRKDNGKVGQHCERVSDGCKHCYAARHNGRNLPNGGTGLDYVRESRDKVETFVDERVLVQPLKWRAPRKVFVCNQTDLFAEFYTDEMRDRVFAVMLIADWHTFQVLTKRPAKMREYLSGPERTTAVQYQVDRLRDQRAVRWSPPGRKTCIALRRLPLFNVWLGVSVEGCKELSRLDELMKTPATVRFASFEPLLEDLGDLRPWLEPRTKHHLRVDVEGALRNRSFDGLQTTDGRPLSRKAAEVELKMLRNAGVKFLPCGSDCHGFDPQYGCPGHRLPTLDWAIIGGESGSGAQPCDVAWIRSIVEQSKTAGVACFVKQLGAQAVWTEREEPMVTLRGGKRVQAPPPPRSDWQPGFHRLPLRHRKGGDIDEFPPDLRVREFPRVGAEVPRA